MIALHFLVSRCSKAVAGILTVVASLSYAPAHGASGYREIAVFEEGSSANLAIVVEYKPDGLRSINVRFNRPPHGATLFFHREQWRVFSENLVRIKDGSEGTEQTFADLDTPGGSLLRMSAVRHGGEVNLTLIHQPAKGDSYPAVVFYLAPADFEDLLKAVVEAAKAEIIVNAESADEFARFRADLGTRFTPEQLQDFDTAIHELQLDVLNRSPNSATVPATGALAMANHKTFPDVVMLGWRVRKARLLREIPEARRRVDSDAAEVAKASAADAPESVTARLAGEKEVLGKLRKDLADTLRHLTELEQPSGKPR